MSAAEIALEAVPRDAPEVLALYDSFIRESDGPLGDAVDLEAEIAAGPPADLIPPGGAFLLARVDGEPAGIGGVRHLDTEVAEVKSMYVSPAHRGLGLGRRLLAELDGIAEAHGCRAVRLDTSDYLREAIGLYTAAGYREVPDYNGNPKADLWFERPLTEPRQLAQAAAREAELRGRLAEAAERLRDANLELAELPLLRHRAERAEAEAAATRAEYENSQSWRLTAPMRRLAALLRR